MAEQTDSSNGSGATGAVDGATEVGTGVKIHKIYVKDLSFESPSTPGIFQGQWQPQLEINIQTTGTQVAEHVYEVVVSATATAKAGDQVGFLVEVQQAGLFEIEGLEGDDLRRALAATCPGMLYPYAREAISDLAVRGGFPPLLLAPANFEAIYESRADELAAQMDPSASGVSNGTARGGEGASN